ncbi:MAG TPA: inorganic phosphate transporter [Anaerolineales bacterium]|jgi:PiT family inorganic phosphate transporter|nr:inorganic phosphate transporter [Anaerolineales bacterium]
MMLSVLIASALVFDFLNGFHDSANLVATMIASRAVSPRRALAIAAAAEFAGPFLFGVAVAVAVGKGLLDPAAVTLPVVLAAVWAAIGWNLLTWHFGLPSSSSHALVGGLLGAAVLAGGWRVVQLQGLYIVLLALFLSPVLGLLAGWLTMRLVLFLARGATPRINSFFKRAQVLTSIGLALSHGSNDAQKTMGIITLGLVVSGAVDSFRVPLWVVVASAGTIALGIASGGWRLIRTLGARIYRIRPVHGFSSQISAAGVIMAAALAGGPVSTTHVVSSAIMGVGGAERPERVRWGVAAEMVRAWLLTIPATAAVSALLLLAWRTINS